VRLASSSKVEVSTFSDPALQSTYQGRTFSSDFTGFNAFAVRESKIIMASGSVRFMVLLYSKMACAKGLLATLF